jgi:hypothetical protein
VRSLQLETALTEFVEAAAEQLQGEIAAGAEVPFELGSRRGRGGPGGTTTPLYCYRALTGAFIAEREIALQRLPAHEQAAGLLDGFDGLDRYLTSAGVEPGRARGRVRANAALRALVQDVFEEQTEFEVRPERLRAALDRLEQSASASASEAMLVATLHGVAISSPELQLTKGLTIARPEALRGAPEGAIGTDEGGPQDHLLVVLSLEDPDRARDMPKDAVARGREVLQDLLRALRLFGDGRVTLGALAWTRVGTGSWGPVAVGAGGRPHGMLVVAAEQEDELRAFCNLVSRRAPHGNELAWALRRFELGCERESSYEALSDHLTALRALLEPEGPTSGLLAGRLAALCATPEHRVALTERIVQALALERAVIAGTAKGRAGDTLTTVLANHLRALLRDVICGHLDPDLAALADELLLDEEPSGEQMLGHPGEAREVLDVVA